MRASRPVNATGVDGGAQYEGIDEHADEIVEFGFAASGDRGADGDVVGPRRRASNTATAAWMTMNRVALWVAGQCGQARVQVRVDREVDAATGGRTHRGAGAVGGQVEQHPADRERGAPVAQLCRDQDPGSSPAPRTSRCQRA